MKVDRCICIKTTFEQLKELAVSGGLDYAGLCEKTKCCSACKMCTPYIKRMLETGETAFMLDRSHPAPVAGVTKVVGLSAAGVKVNGAERPGG